MAKLVLYHGKPVWVGLISRDIGSRMTIHRRH
jgi:hypothetical protein